MDKAPRVLVVIPAFNRASLVGVAIESVIAQTFSSWRLVVVDDNSNDGTWEVIEGYARADARISGVRNTSSQLGPGGARALGLKNRGSEQFVAFVDSDDRWQPFHLDELVRFLDENADVDVVFGNLRRLTASGDIVVESKLDEELPEIYALPQLQNGDYRILRGAELPRRALSVRFNWGLQTSVTRVEVFDKIPIRSLRIGEDVLFALEALSKGIRVAYTPRVHVDYLMHEGNISGANRSADHGHRESVALAEEALWSTWIPAYVRLDRECRKIVSKRLSDVRIWDLSFHCYAQRGLKGRAVYWALRSLVGDPLNRHCWKAVIRACLG